MISGLCNNLEALVLFHEHREEILISKGGEEALVMFHELKAEKLAAIHSDSTLPVVTKQWQSKIAETVQFRTLYAPTARTSNSSTLSRHLISSDHHAMAKIECDGQSDNLDAAAGLEGRLQLVRAEDERLDALQCALRRAIIDSQSLSPTKPPSPTRAQSPIQTALDAERSSSKLPVKDTECHVADTASLPSSPSKRNESPPSQDSRVAENGQQGSAASMPFLCNHRPSPLHSSACSPAGKGRACKWHTVSWPLMLPTHEMVGLAGPGPSKDDVRSDKGKLYGVVGSEWQAEKFQTRFAADECQSCAGRGDAAKESTKRVLRLSRREPARLHSGRWPFKRLVCHSLLPPLQCGDGSPGEAQPRHGLAVAHSDGAVAAASPPWSRRDAASFSPGLNGTVVGILRSPFALTLNASSPASSRAISTRASNQASPAGRAPSTPSALGLGLRFRLRGCKDNQNTRRQGTERSGEVSRAAESMADRSDEEHRVERGSGPRSKSREEGVSMTGLLLVVAGLAAVAAGVAVDTFYGCELRLYPTLAAGEARNTALQAVWHGAGAAATRYTAMASVAATACGAGAQGEGGSGGWSDSWDGRPLGRQDKSDTVAGGDSDLTAEESRVGSGVESCGSVLHAGMTACSDGGPMQMHMTAAEEKSSGGGPRAAMDKEFEGEFVEGREAAEHIWRVVAHL